MKLIELNSSKVLNIVNELYNEVWGKTDSEFLERLIRHSRYPGFHGIVALSDNQPAGYVYGYKSEIGQYYNGLIRNALSENEAKFWLEDCFEVVELGVHPEYRRKKLGIKLMNELCNSVNQTACLLTTQSDNTPARKLYESLGWVVIKDSFYPNVSVPYVIMGKCI